MKKCLLVLTAVLMLFFGRAGSTAGALEDGRIEKEDRLNLGKEKYYTAKEFFYLERDAAKAEELLAEAEEVFRRVEEDYDRYYWLRSEEHTSELQSRPHLVCRLLLEKKKH